MCHIGLTAAIIAYEYSRQVRDTDAFGFHAAYRCSNLRFYFGCSLLAVYKVIHICGFCLRVRV